MTFRVLVVEPEYLSLAKLHEIVTRAGKLEGIGDFRPTYGRYRIDSFSVEEV